MYKYLSVIIALDIFLGKREIKEKTTISIFIICIHLESK